MPSFSETIKQYASKRMWQSDSIDETTCNIPFVNNTLTYIRVAKVNSQVQFILSLGTPEKYLVHDINNFRHELSNLLLYQNSIKEGFWGIFEARTHMGIMYFPGYTRIIDIKELNQKSFDEIMDDIVSEFNLVDQ